MGLGDISFPRKARAVVVGVAPVFPGIPGGRYRLQTGALNVNTLRHGRRPARPTIPKFQWNEGMRMLSCEFIVGRRAVQALCLCIREFRQHRA